MIHHANDAGDDDGDDDAQDGDLKIAIRISEQQ